MINLNLELQNLAKIKVYIYNPSFLKLKLSD